MFIKFLTENGYDKKFLIEREFPIYPFFIDFAFVDIKLAIEIDGSQHLLEDRIESDKKKDKLLLENGWKIIRFSENIVKKNWDLIKTKLNEFTINENTIYEKVGIIKSPRKKYQKKDNQRLKKYGLNSDKMFSDEEINYHLRTRKVVRPPKEVLLEEIQNISFTTLGKKYGVTDKCISKWCKFYGLPSTKYELKGLYKKNSLPTLTCSYCGKEFKAHDYKQVQNKTHFCCEEHMHEYKKSLTLANIDGVACDITKDLILQESKKYSSISEMAKNMSVSRFVLSRRLKEFNINSKDLFYPL